MLESNLKKYFNFPQFRPGQKEVVESIIAGHDVVALMPTGGGKSLCYQLPAIMSDRVSIVISPLIALMKDQVDSLNARGIPATFINSALNSAEIENRKRSILEGKVKILYIAPERFGSGGFSNFFKDLDVYLLAIDEAHCVSQWGHDFRPDYLSLKEHIKNMKKRPIIAAFTATATPEVKEDIIKRLELKKPEVFVRGFDRPNLKFFVQKDLESKYRIREALRIINSIKGAGIVYAITRKETEAAAEYLRRNGVEAFAYHAGMSADQREKIQNDFMENRFQVIVATIAFGMGVDKADIRFVIHAGMPSSIEGYYQEAGRAGRDGDKAYCILLHAKKDFGLHYHFMIKGKQEMLSQGKSWEEVSRVSEIKYQRLEKIKEYATGIGCRRKMILNYFNDPEVEKIKDNCQACDVCLNFKWQSLPEEKNKRIAKKDNFIVVNEEENIISGTILETVNLYKQKYSPEQIAKIRSLGTSTILNHLINWYLLGGEFELEKFITKEEESQILVAMSKADTYQKLRPIKDQLPEDISYEKIRMVIAKIQRIRLE